MNKLSDFIFKHRYGLSGAIIIHLLFLLSAKNIVINKYNRITPDDLIEVNFIPTENLPEEMQDKREEEQQEVVNKAFNLEDKREYSEENYDARYKHLEEQVYKELKEFEKKEFEKLKSGQTNEMGINNTTPENIGSKKNKDNDVTEEQYKPSSSGKLAGKTTADFELHMRQKEYLPIPAYKCIGSGTVSISIKVNRNGKVVDAKIIESESNYSEDCMREALSYAKRAKFTASSMSPDPQEGKIIYRYIAQ